MSTNSPIVDAIAAQANESPAEVLRKKIKLPDLLDEISEIEKNVEDHWPTMTNNQVNALKLLADLKFRKLLKVLPDLKATEHSMGDSASKVVFQLNLGGEPKKV